MIKKAWARTITGTETSERPLPRLTRAKGHYWKSDPDRVDSFWKDETGKKYLDRGDGNINFIESNNVKKDTWLSRTGRRLRSERRVQPSLHGSGSPRHSVYDPGGWYNHNRVLGTTPSMLRETMGNAFRTTGSAIKDASSRVGGAINSGAGSVRSGFSRFFSGSGGRHGGRGVTKSSSDQTLSTAKSLLQKIYEEDPSYWPDGLSVGMFTSDPSAELHLVLDKKSSVPAGFVGWYERNRGLHKVGYYSIGILPEHRGKGLAKEAIKKVIQTRAPGVDEVRAMICPHNSSSRILADRLGIRVEDF